MYASISLIHIMSFSNLLSQRLRGLAWIFFRAARSLKLLRVDDGEEKGIDALEHSQQTAYNLQESEGPNSWRVLWLE